MANRRVGSQTPNLIPNHKKSGIDPIYLAVGGVRHTVGKLSMRAITLLQTAWDPRSARKVMGFQSCGSPIWGDFETPIWESQERKPI
jgi:hypothetical protein